MSGAFQQVAASRIYFVVPHKGGRNASEPLLRRGAMTSSPVPLHSVRGRLQLSDEVAAHLRDQVMSGVLRPGEFIRPEVVATQLGVSVTPVREALLLLRGEDVVRLLPRRGFAVAPLTRVDVEDLFDVQARLAGELAARAVRRAGPEDLAGLADLNRRLVAAVTAQSPDGIEYFEHHFHRAINLTADSRKLAYVLRSASQYLPRRFFTADEHWRKAVDRDHEQILAAFRDKNAEGARAAVEAHILDGRLRLLQHLDEVGFWADGHS
ncbi:MAG: GntR family transcriptional regulator [Actinobacteria bacterium]|nr:GntR family transcriptional regulator [Actinomycetota bacterium]MCA1719642.1 GntR family transcriptional regulator [Actinomycetota bacterium]